MRVGDRGGCVGVLGPTTIGSESATPRQRALVAALALAGDRGAGIDELADGVWGGRLPRSARSSLQNQMTRLRRVHGDDFIACEHARYRLGRSTDVEQFEEVLSRVESSSLSTGAVESLAAALRSWRGIPYEDLTDSHTAEVERARLLHARGRAADLLATGRILLRDHEQCIAELRVEIEYDPDRDRPWELLFVALQRAGRPGEALAAHTAHVARLREQFAVEPSQALLDTGRALRRGEPLDFASTASLAPPIVIGSVGHHGARRRRCRVRNRPQRGRVDP